MLADFSVEDRSGKGSLLKIKFDAGERPTSNDEYHLEYMQSENIVRKDAWAQRMHPVVSNCFFSGKERKQCKKCFRVYPFFKTECSKCAYKFPKTRGGISANMQTESYTLQFWSKLYSDIGLFDSLTSINDYLEETDLMSVRDLYKKIKEVLS